MIECEKACHHPIAVLGLVLIGASGALFIHTQFKMTRTASVSSYKSLKYTSGRFGKDVPPNYFQIARKHRWATWPAYLMWLCLFAGIIMLLIDLLFL